MRMGVRWKWRTDSDGKSTCDGGTGTTLSQLEHVKELLAAEVAQKGFQGL